MWTEEEGEGNEEMSFALYWGGRKALSPLNANICSPVVAGMVMTRRRGGCTTHLKHDSYCKGETVTEGEMQKEIDFMCLEQSRTGKDQQQSRQGRERT